AAEHPGRHPHQGREGRQDPVPVRDGDGQGRHQRVRQLSRVSASPPTKERAAEGARRRRSAPTRQRADEGARRRRSAPTKERADEGARRRRSAPTKERADEGARRRRSAPTKERRRLAGQGAPASRRPSEPLGNAHPTPDLELSSHAAPALTAPRDSPLAASP